MERNELATVDSIIPNKTPLEISYGFMVEPGATSTAGFLVVGQLHQDNYAGAAPAGPPFDIFLSGDRMGTPGDKMGISIHWGNDTDPQTKMLFLDTANIDRGHVYDMKISAIFDPSGNGRLVVQRDGVTIADYTGPLGYNQQNGVYWAEGIYRSDNATETIAANYNHLEITTGNSVKLPEAAAFIDKPVLQVSHTDPGLGATPGASVQMSGTAKAGTTVSIFDGTLKVGTAVVDATGHYQTSVSVTGLGAHGLTAYATDATGRMGITSGATTILIGSAADVVAKLGTLSAANVGSIVLTGDHVLHLTSIAQRSYAQQTDAGALSKIVGGYSLVLSETVTGQSYDRRDSTYASDGRLVETTRWAGQKLILDQTLAADGSQTVKAWAPDGTSTVTIVTATNFITTYEKFDAKGTMVWRQDYRTDGTSTLHTYDTTGSELSVVVYAADKSRVETNTFKGQAYTTQTTVYAADGHRVSVERFAADGTKIFSQNWAADGSWTLATVASSGTSAYTVYASTGAILRDERFYANGHVSSDQTFRSDGTSTLYRYAADGTATNIVVYAADKSRVDTNLNIKNMPYTSQALTFDASNHLVNQERFTANGTKIFSQTWNSDTSYIVHQYSATTGKETGSTYFGADGSRVVTTFGITGQTYAAQALHYDASGRTTGQDRFDAAGRMIASEVWNADGSKKIFALDAAGHVTGFTILALDKSHTDTVYAPGTTTAASTIVYDGAGHILVKQAFNAAGELVTSEKWAANGSHVTNTYVHATLVKADVYDASGKLVSETLYGSSGSAPTTGAAHLSRMMASDAPQPGDSHEVHQFDASGALTSILRWVGETLVYSEEFKADGSRTVDVYDSVTGAETGGVVYRADHSRVEYAFSASGPVTVQMIEYDTQGHLLEKMRWSGDQLIYSQVVAVDGSKTIQTVDNPNQSSVKHYAPSGDLVTADRFNAAGIRVYSDVRDADGSRQTHTFDGTTGVETGSTLYHADGSREVVNLAVKNAAYATQHAAYDATGKLTELVRHYDSDAGQVAMEQHYRQDGSSDVHSYDRAGQETSQILTGADHTRAESFFTYAGSGSTPVATREDVYDATGYRMSTDLTASDGSHDVTVASANVTLQSHTAVADVFTSFGNDTFVFKAGFGQDTIKNFHVAASELHDLIQIDHSIATDFAQLAMHASGNNTVIDLGSHDSITLVNVHLAQLSAHDFAFV